MEKIFIKPMPGVKLFNPATNNFVPESGISINKNQYWSRRIAEGGVIVTKQKGMGGRVEKEKSVDSASEPGSKPAPEPESKPEPEPKTASKKISNFLKKKAKKKK